MIVFIPMAEGQHIKREVYQSINSQTLKAEMRFCVTPGAVRSHRNYSKLRRNVESASRSKAREYAVWCTDVDYIVMQDYDREHLRNDNFEAMKRFLESHPTFGAVSVSGVRNPHNKHHIDIGCVMYRYDVYTRLDFTNKYGRCLCKEVTEQIRSIGLEFDYLDNIVRTKEITK